MSDGDFRIERFDSGWAVIEDVDKPGEFDNYPGKMRVAGIPDEDEARAALNRCRNEYLAQQCREWEEHAYGLRTVR